MVPKSFKAEGVLSSRLWEVPAIQERYRAAMRQLLAGPWNEARILDDLRHPRRGASAAVAPAARDDPHRRDAIETFVKGRRAAVEAELTGPAPAWPPDPPPSQPTPIALSGSFTAPWIATAPANPMGAGKMQPDPVRRARTQGFRRQRRLLPGVRPGRPAARVAARALHGHHPRRRHQGGFLAVTFIVDPLLLDGGPGLYPLDGFAAWAIVVTQDGPGPPRLAIFGNTGELRLDEAAAREGGQVRGTFTIRAMLP